MPVIRNTRLPFLESSKKDETAINRSSARIRRKMDMLDDKMDSMYRDIYVSRPDNKQNLDSMIDSLDLAVDKLADENVSISGMSELLRRVTDQKGNTSKLFNDVQSLFGNQEVINSLFANESSLKYISAQNYQYDMICRYLPKLLDALEIKKDNVLCSDNFSKDFITPKSAKSSKEEVIKFASNSKRVIDEYDFDTFAETTYMNVSRYGEDFIYVVPYNVALKRLLDKRNMGINNSRLGQYSFQESFIKEEAVGRDFAVSEDYKNFKKKAVTISSESSSSNEDNFKGTSVNLYFNDSNVIIESVNEVCVLGERVSKETLQSMNHIFQESERATGDLTKDLEQVNSKNNKLTSQIVSDGLIIPSELKDSDKIEDRINGAVLERLPRENIIPIYIGKKCLGYYYLEFKEDPTACGYCGNTHTTPGLSSGMFAQNMSENQQELAIRFISSRISEKIDAHFINANKDLKEEIYSVLQYNQKFDLSRSNDIAVTFLPAEDVIHCYNKLDEKTHRGISDLQKSVVPAMLYILLYLTDIIGKITRSTDKRIYYVKQNVETNVARTMMNVVQQIKKGNMGMRQIESINNILNIVGKYNDYIIPLGQSGDPPIQFEVMNGQDIQTPTDIMDKMEEAAVNATGVPFEMVNSTFQQDFAIRFSMSNTRFLKSVYTRQRTTQKYLSRIYTRIYNYEYDENNSLIEIILPPPTYLTMTNNQQLIDNINQLADKIVEVEMQSESDEVKYEFKRLYTRNYLGTYIDYESVERMINVAKINVETTKNPSTEEASSDSNFDDMM